MHCYSGSAEESNSPARALRMNREDSMPTSTLDGSRYIAAFVELKVCVFFTDFRQSLIHPFWHTFGVFQRVVLQDRCATHDLHEAEGRYASLAT